MGLVNMILDLNDDLDDATDGHNGYCAPSRGPPFPQYAYGKKPDGERCKAALGRSILYVRGDENETPT